MWLQLQFCFLSFQYIVSTNQQLVNNNNNNSEQKNVSTVEVLNATVNNATHQEIMQRNFIVINQTIDNTNKIKKFDDFRPSTQFGGFGSMFLNQQSKTFDLPSTKNWSWSKVDENSDETSIETPWRYSKVKFPAPTEARPYPNYDPNDKTYEKPSVVTKPIDMVYQHPAIQPPPPIKPTILPLKQPDSMWDKFLTFTGFNNKLPISSPKSYFNDYPPQPDHGINHIDPNSFQFNDFDHNSFHGNNLDHYNQGFYNPKEHYTSMESHRGGINPWKKILKVLATIIPLGLLLSALTPTIITVSSTNDTETRFNRKDDETGIVLDQVANSLKSLKKLQQDGCEQKVFCELMVNAMLSKNAEEHIKNLLDNFAKRSGISETSFTNVLEAVKNQDCSPIICKNIKDPT